MIKTITTWALSLLAAVPAFAQAESEVPVLSEDVWTSVTYISPDPNPGEYDANEKFPSTLALGTRKSGGKVSLENNSNHVTMVTPAGKIVEGLFSYDTFFGRVNIIFDSDYTEQGTYTVSIPEKTVKYTCSKEGADPAAGYNPDYTFDFIVGVPKPPVQSPLVNPVFIPASGSTVSHIGKNISITFPGAEPGWGLVCINCVNVTCVSGEFEGDVWTMYDNSWFELDNGELDKSRCVFNFKNVISAPGVYELVCSAETFRTVKDGQTVYNPYEIRARFTVSDETDPNALTLDVCKAVNPVNDEPVRNFRQLEIEFPQCGAPELGLADGNKLNPDEEEPPICGAPMKAPSINNTPSLKITSDGTNQTWLASSWRIRSNNKSIVIYFDDNTLTRDGEYTLTIPGNLLRIKGSSDPMIYNPILRIPYTLKNYVGVEENTVEKIVVAPVYDMNGNVVVDFATEADVLSLPAGIYLFNGKKILVK